MAWDLHRDLDALARKGLIDKNTWRRISINNGKTK
jgi:hypothetical protein